MEQTNLDTPIGTIEPEKTILEPTKVKIVKVEVIAVPKAKAEKVSFEVKHPDKEETVKLSTVSFVVGDKVKISGTWMNLDEDGNLQKGSAIVTFLKSIDADTLSDCVGKEADTVLDGDYLCFKAY